MIKLNYHKDNSIGLDFLNYDEYYETLGYLTKDNNIKIYTHQNQISGARGPQGKLHKTNHSVNYPRPLSNSFSISNDNRLSVSEYVENLIDSHNFVQDDPTNCVYTNYIHPNSYNNVKATVPPEYYEAFDRGYNY